MPFPNDMQPFTGRRSHMRTAAWLGNTVESGMHNRERSPQLNEANISSSQIANASSHSGGHGHVVSLVGSDPTCTRTTWQSIMSTDERDAVVINMVGLQGSMNAYLTIHDWVPIQGTEVLVFVQQMPLSSTAMASQEPLESAYSLVSSSSTKSGSSCSLSSWTSDQAVMTPSTLTNLDADSTTSGSSTMTLGPDWAVPQVGIPLESSIEDINGIGAWAETQ